MTVLVALPKRTDVRAQPATPGYQAVGRSPARIAAQRHAALAKWTRIVGRSGVRAE